MTSTPLHPKAVHKHRVKWVDRTHQDARHQPYEVHYCGCGMALAYIPRVSRID